MKYFIFCGSFIFFFVFFSCKKENINIVPIPPTLNPEFLIGKWVEEEAEEILAFAGSNHIIEFTDSLFLLERAYWTDVVTSDDCQNNYTAYFKGAIQIDQDSIRFNGLATNADYELIPPKCDRYAVFKTSFAYKKERANILVFNPNEEIYNQIQLIKK